MEAEEDEEDSSWEGGGGGGGEVTASDVATAPSEEWGALEVFASNPDVSRSGGEPGKIEFEWQKPSIDGKPAVVTLHWVTCVTDCSMCYKGGWDYFRQQ